MRTLATFLALFICGFASSVPAQPTVGVQITIDQIVKDDHITGTVTGLTDTGRASRKVVVYVKTDKWYIHPYEQGGEGKSFALVSAKDSWTIETIYRGIPASAIAVLLVKRDAKVPSPVLNVREITNEAIIVRELEGTPDYGKL